jgi:hypothetical protein
MAGTRFAGKSIRCGGLWGRNQRRPPLRRLRLFLMPRRLQEDALFAVYMMGAPWGL